MKSSEKDKAFIDQILINLPSSIIYYLQIKDKLMLSTDLMFKDNPFILRIQKLLIHP